jgi:hypothetical protein
MQVGIGDGDGALRGMASTHRQCSTFVSKSCDPAGCSSAVSAAPGGAAGGSAGATVEDGAMRRVTSLFVLVFLACLLAAGITHRAQANRTDYYLSIDNPDPDYVNGNPRQIGDLLIINGFWSFPEIEGRPINVAVYADDELIWFEPAIV